MEVLGVLVVAGFLVYARAQITNGRMTVGLFVAFIIALIKLYDPVRRMSGLNNSFQQAFGASGRIFEIMSLEAERDNGHRILPEFKDQIEFEDVHFGYEADERVLDGISFTVRRGEVVAIVGSSGAGKSTLVNLLPRFYDVSSGRILIDGVDCARISAPIAEKPDCDGYSGCDPLQRHHPRRISLTAIRLQETMPCFKQRKPRWWMTS